ncbi:ankyrin repeat-containing protein BDA1-like [Punica granatum]|uniref:Ankyrin repeat-containing protein BDA1-like n=1 Tax=Punica granatum TaxID=22663 RepID=A0A6P8DFJ0_PUNGR|nr:ankyrin repeat-containing protein BDA1-like [Punica granatum]
MTINAALIRVSGSGGRAPLHFAAEIGLTDLLAEFLFVCPSSIEDVTVQLETAVHIAVKRVQLRVLFGWLLRINREDVLKWKDIDGNTVLHIATFSSQLQVVKMLVKYVENTKNCDNMTAHEFTLGKYFSADLCFTEKWERFLGFSIDNGSTGNDNSGGVALAVAILIATDTYKAILSPPDEYWQENHTDVLNDMKQ